MYNPKFPTNKEQIHAKLFGGVNDKIEVFYLDRICGPTIVHTHQKEIVLDPTSLLHPLVDAMPDLIYVKNREGKFLLANQACALSFGDFVPGDLLGKSDFDFVDAELAQMYADDDQAVMDSGEPLIGRVEPTKAGRWLSTTKVPLRDKETNDVIGVIGISRDITESKENEFKLDELAVALRLKNEEMESNIRIAAEFWRAIVPERCPDLTDTPFEGQIELHHRYIPSEVIGGDYFNVRLVDDHRLTAFIADVTGHDVRASLAAALINGLLEEIESTVLDPGQILQEMNHRFFDIVEGTGRDLFFTACCVVIDLKTRELLYSNAGHPDGLQISKTNGATHLAQTQPSVGLMRHFEYQTRTLPLRQGDMVMLYTDGLVETQGVEEGSEYGIDRVETFLLEHQQEDSESMIEHMLDDVRKFSRTGNFQDDLCILEVKFIGE